MGNWFRSSKIPSVAAAHDDRATSSELNSARHALTATGHFGPRLDYSSRFLAAAHCLTADARVLIIYRDRLEKDAVVVASLMAVECDESAKTYRVGDYQVH